MMLRRFYLALALLALSALPAAPAAAQGPGEAADDSEDDAVEVVVAPTPRREVTAADLDALRDQMASLRHDLDEARAELAARDAAAAPTADASPAADATEAEAAPSAPSEPEVPFLGRAPHSPMGNEIADGLYVGGYVQAQYSAHEDSRNEIRPDGTPMNMDGFAVRRSRIRVQGDWQYAGGIVEIDGTTSFGGYRVNLRRAEAYLQYRLAPNETPLLQFGAGVMDTMFGYDLPTSSRVRAFMERGLMIRAMYPSPQDVGVRLNVAYQWFRLTLQALNGTPLYGADNFAGWAPTNFPDFLVRAGAEVPVIPELTLAGHLSVVYGHGLDRGQPASKGGVSWSDRNQDGVIQSGEVVGIPPRASTPSQSFDRWVVGLDLEATLHTSIGNTQLYGEVMVGQNMDRSLFVSDPILTGINQRMMGFYVAAVQDITEYAYVGFRYDYYDPNADLFDARAGRIQPFSQTVETFSPVVGLQLPNLARLSFQYDVVRDHFGRDARGVPVDLANNVWTLRLQVQL
jgi:hypothetical protein